MSQIEIKNLSKIYNENTTYEVRAIDNISLNINQGEFVVILGPSGTGKSTLLNVLGGMDRHSRGEVQINDIKLSKLDEKQLGIYRREQIGFIFQFYNLLPNLSAFENVQIAESISKNSLDSLEVLSSVGLKDRVKNFPSELSGGEQQRVSIARAIVKNPTLLLCDEPTGALDSKTGGKIIELLLDVSKKYNKTVIIVTHNSKIAEVANRVIYMLDGKIIEDKHNNNPKNPRSIIW